MDYIPFNPFPVNKENLLLGPMQLDGELVDMSEGPRRDFGPVGSKPKRPDFGPMFSWVSDFIEEGGSLKNENVRDTGMVPCAPSSLLQQSSLKDNQVKHSPFHSNQSTPIQSNQSSPIYPPNDFKRSKPARWGYSLTSFSYAAVLKTSLPISPEAGVNSTHRDVKKFQQEYGFGGSVRPGLLYKPRKGKYYKEFS